MERNLLAAILAALMTSEADAMDTQTLEATDLDALQWQARPVVVLAQPDDPRLARQLALFEAAAGAMADREMPVIVGKPAEGGDLLSGNPGERIPPDAGQGGFAVLLIGKDGGVKARFGEVVDPAAMLDLVDAMPMRRREAERP